MGLFGFDAIAGAGVFGCMPMYCGWRQDGYLAWSGRIFMLSDALRCILTDGTIGLSTRAVRTLAIRGRLPDRAGPGATPARDDRFIVDYFG